MSDQTERPARRVVLAEDDALIRLDLAEMLGEEGYQVAGQAGDGEAALAVIKDVRPDLAILDVRMPKLDGISVAEEIARERICPVIILTAFNERELVERARDAGAMTYLTKPFDKKALMPAIELAISRYDELLAYAQEVASLGDQLETRKLVERAKGVLQDKLGVKEPEAFRWIQKTAMDKRVPMRQVAQLVIDEADTLGARSGDADTAASPEAETQESPETPGSPEAPVAEASATEPAATEPSSESAETADGDAGPDTTV